jgi:serine/threonine kinase 16
MLMLKPTLQLNGKKYKVISQIGEGGFAYVYHVKSVAMKDNKHEDFAIKKMICQTQEQIDEAKKEIDIMIKIKHPNVLSLFDFTLYSNKKGQQEVMLLMPLFLTSVQHIIDNGYGYPYCSFHDGLDLVKVLRNCIDGLAAVHQAGYRHADLKPANILLNEDFSAVLTDFGSCMPLVTTVTTRIEALEVQEKAAAFTTASYRAPELFDTPSNIVIDGKSDIWSFGCLMYCFMYSKTPFESVAEGLSTLSVLTGQFSYPLENIWPEEYCDLIDQCLVVDPHHRLNLEDVQLRLKRITTPPTDMKIPPEKKESHSTSQQTKKSFFNLPEFNLKAALSPTTATTTSPHHHPMEGIGSDSFKNKNKNDFKSGGSPHPQISPTTPTTTTAAAPVVAMLSSPMKEMNFADFENASPFSTSQPEEIIFPGEKEGKKDNSGHNKLGEEGGGREKQGTEDDYIFAEDGEVDTFEDFASFPGQSPRAEDDSTTPTPPPPPVVVADNNDHTKEEKEKGAVIRKSESEEFGDFSPLPERQNSKTVLPTQQPQIIPKQVQLRHQPPLIQSIEILDLHYLIINDLVMKRIIKQGPVNTMRLGGFPKKMIKKPVRS